MLKSKYSDVANRPEEIDWPSNYRNPFKPEAHKFRAPGHLGGRILCSGV